MLLSSAPYAVTGTAAGTGRAMLAGTYPRERRTISGPSAVERTTESSVRMWIGRSWLTIRSAMPSSRPAASSSW